SPGGKPLTSRHQRRYLECVRANLKRHPWLQSYFTCSMQAELPLTVWALLSFMHQEFVVAGCDSDDMMTILVGNQGVVRSYVRVWEDNIVVWGPPKADIAVTAIAQFEFLFDGLSQLN